MLLTLFEHYNHSHFVPDVSQPSLGVNGDHVSKDCMDTPPLSPMYSGADVSGQVSTARGKASVVFHPKSPGCMETHWEEDPHLLKSKRNLEAG